MVLQLYFFWFLFSFLLSSTVSRARTIIQLMLLYSEGIDAICDFVTGQKLYICLLKNGKANNLEHSHSIVSL